MSDDDRRKDVLMIALSAAVPLRIRELQGMPDSTRERQIRSWARSAVEPVASRGDVLLYGGGGRGDTARVFNEFAKGLAALAYSPGGVTFAGAHWCLDHSACLPADDRTRPSPALTDVAPSADYL